MTDTIWYLSDTKRKLPAIKGNTLTLTIHVLSSLVLTWFPSFWSYCSISSLGNFSFLQEQRLSQGTVIAYCPCVIKKMLLYGNGLLHELGVLVTFLVPIQSIYFFPFTT